VNGTAKVRPKAEVGPAVSRRRGMSQGLQPALGADAYSSMSSRLSASARSSWLGRL
jgi:hypothetical protein